VSEPATEALPWLLRAPQDFKARCKSITGPSHEGLLELLELSDFALDSYELGLLARAGRRLGPTHSDGLVDFKLGLTSNATMDHLAPILEASALRHRITLSTVVGGYGQSFQESGRSSSVLNTAGLDGVLIALDHRGLPLSELADKPEEAVAAAIEHVRMIAGGFRKNGISIVVVQTIALPPTFLFGNLDRQISGSLRAQIHEFNRLLTAICAKERWTLLDVDAIASQVGIERWHDPVKWNMAKLPFDVRFAPLYGDHIARLVAATRGRARKCLILDLDNTLWGGVIGDDGLDGIRLGQGDALGEAYVAIQKTVLELRDRGIVLAVCSKNEEDIARQPFREHPEMLLCESDIAVFLANWQPKSVNIQTIASQLNLGIDSMVLLDDNPAERNQVRRELPAVATPELPEDPAYFPYLLTNCGWFESVQFTREDSQRAHQYKVEQEREEAKVNSPDMATFLRSLRMIATLRSFDAQGRMRIGQLFNKTNQFNLTGQRYTEAEVLGFEELENYFTLQVRLEDRYGDNGIVSALVCTRHDDHWRINNWVMSCRVFGRDLEAAIVNHLVARAREDGAQSLVADYMSTKRNQVIAALLGNLGFQNSDQSEGTWQLRLEGFENQEHAIALEIDSDE
jgi:FkbH-like protein